MTPPLFVDTSVWSLAFRRDAPSDSAEVSALQKALVDGDHVVSTGIVLQELLQGFAGPRQHEVLVARFEAIELVVPSRLDHIKAAELRNHCRRNGVQLATVDALLASLCLGHNLLMLTTDRDFLHAAPLISLSIWQP